MSLIKKSSGKNLYTLIECVIIVTKRNEGFRVEDISDYLTECGFSRTVPSVQFKIGRMMKIDHFEEMFKVSTDVVKKALKDAEVLMNEVDK